MTVFGKEAGWARGEFVEVAGHVYDPDVRMRFCCCLDEDGEELFGEQRMALVLA